LQLGFEILKWLLIAALIAIFLILVVFRPIRRAMLLRHLEKPLWVVAPTARVHNLWRRAIALLADFEIQPGDGETPQEFARRADGELRTKIGVGAPSLQAAAAIVEKIAYAGRGLGPDDDMAMRNAVSAFLRDVGPRVEFGKRVMSAWGPAPDVEA
jgi:hypothetical protein